MSLRSGPPPTIRAFAHMGRVRALLCVCCTRLGQAQEGLTMVHHIRAGGEKRNDWLVLPLCWACHQGPLGVHGDQTYLRMLKLSEWGLLALVLEELAASARS